MPSVSEATPVTNGHKPSVEELKLKVRDSQQVDTLDAPLPNPSLQVTADHKLKAVDAPVFAPKAGEVLVHVKATGICGYEQSKATKTICGQLIISIAQMFTFGRLDALDL